ncbi:MAG: TIGR03790 family protein [Verrucomicrobiota bacterium]|nr:TIGR03790 family protein [Verrucomicrobiota bacterium]
MNKTLSLIFLAQIVSSQILGKEGTTVAVVYNSILQESKSVADHYAKLRNVPENNLIGLPLSKNHTISRGEFTKTLEQPLAKALAKKKILNGNTGTIRYLVLCWGVPFRVDKDNSIKSPDGIPAPLQRNEASVDSELSLLPQLNEQIERTGVIKNPAFNANNPKLISPNNGLLMVARLDGPSSDLAKSLVDRAIAAEKKGLWGRAYIDLRGINSGALKSGEERLRQVAQIISRSGFTTVIDNEPTTMPVGFPGDQIAFYAGWYGINVEGLFAEETVDFATGAIAYHLHSYNGSMIRDAHSRWIGPFINKGATATFGSVFEPYLELTPNQPLFFARIIQNGFNFAEAGYAATPVLSWQTVFVGDPLYRPFGKTPQEVESNLIKNKSSDIQWFRLIAINQGLTSGAPKEAAILHIEQLKEAAKSSILQEKLGELYAGIGKKTKAEAAFKNAINLSKSTKQKQRIDDAIKKLSP